MDKNFKKIIDKYGLKNEKAVVLAVSGGPDSVALLDLAQRFLPKNKLVVAHANHGLRVESRWDENLVAELCQEYEIELYTEKLQLKSTSEAEAREARYDFLDRIREQVGAKYVITAHHLNDQAETVLLALTRGTGPLALWGMAELSGNILRPFLNTPKSEITKYVRKRHLAYHLDRSNWDLKYARNRMRSKVMPQLLKINKQFLEAIGRNATQGNELQEAWSQIINQKIKKISQPNILIIAKLQKEPIFIQKELIRYMLAQTTGKKDGISAENVQKVLDLLTLSRGKKTEIGKISVTKGIKNLSFNLKETPKTLKSVRWSSDEAVKFGEFDFKKRIGSGTATKNNILLPQTFGYNLTIRTWRNGDRIKTKAGTKKLQDVFSDAKIEAKERKRWPVIVSGNKIVWVPLLAASREALPKSTEKVLKIEVKNERN